jgi:organic anion transporter 5A
VPLFTCLSVLPSLSVFLHGLIDVWMHGRTDRLTHGRMADWMDGWMDGWLVGWMDGLTDRWTDVWMCGSGCPRGASLEGAVTNSAPHSTHRSRRPNRVIDERFMPPSFCLLILRWKESITSIKAGVSLEAKLVTSLVLEAHKREKPMTLKTSKLQAFHLRLLHPDRRLRQSQVLPCLARRFLVFLDMPLFHQVSSLSGNALSHTKRLRIAPSST